MAYINGERFDATEIAHVPWRALVNRPDYEDLLLVECGLRAKRVTSNARRRPLVWVAMTSAVQARSR